MLWTTFEQCTSWLEYIYDLYELVTNIYNITKGQKILVVMGIYSWNLSHTKRQTIVSNLFHENFQFV
jgi:hypothetical protein